MELNPGEVSQVFSDPEGAHFIYKMISKNTLPLEDAKSEIRTQISSQRYRDSMKSFEGNVVFNDAYFISRRKRRRPDKLSCESQNKSLTPCSELTTLATVSGHRYALKAAQNIEARAQPLRTCACVMSGDTILKRNIPRAFCSIDSGLFPTKTLKWRAHLNALYCKRNFTY